MFEILKDSIRIPSSSGYEVEVQNYYSSILEKNGFDLELQHIDSSDRFNILASKIPNKNKSTTLFYGHTDTVTPEGDYKSRWVTNMYDPVEKDGKLYGIGASDMKGGIAAFIEATKNTKANVKIILGVGEETDSDGMWKVYKDRQDFFNNVSLIISAEPSLGLKVNQITAGRTGRVLYDANFNGKSEHVMRHKEAIDAIGKLVNYVNKLYSARDTNKILKSPMSLIQVSKIGSETVGMSVCGKATALIEAFLGPEDTKENLLESLRQITEDDNDTITILPRKTEYLQGYFFDNFTEKDHLVNVIKSHTGLDLEIVHRKSVADDNILALLKIPVITWGPQGNNEHKPNESVDLSSVKQLVEMYKDFLNSVSKN